MRQRIYAMLWFYNNVILFYRSFLNTVIEGVPAIKTKLVLDHVFRFTYIERQLEHSLCFSCSYVCLDKRFHHENALLTRSIQVSTEKEMKQNCILIVSERSTGTSSQL